MDFEQAILEGVSNLGTFEPEEIEYIQLGMIDDDPNNFYELRDIETLADNISVCGLQQPIRLRPNPTADGRYIIVSGHRRRAALAMLAKEDSRWARAMCIVDRRLGSKALRELQLIYANANTRQLTSYEIGEQAKKVESLLYQLKEEGYAFPGRMRDHVAKAVNVSKSKLSRIKVIQDKLIPAFNRWYKAGKMSEAAAYAMAQMLPAWQQLIYDHQTGKQTFDISRFTDMEIRDLEGAISKASRQCAELTCPSGPACQHSQKRMTKAAKLERWQRLPCSGCCRECPQLATCKDSCKKAADVKDDKKAAAKAAEAEAEQRRMERDKPRLDFIRTAYERAGLAMRAAGGNVPQLLRMIGIAVTSRQGKEYTQMVLSSSSRAELKNAYRSMPWSSCGDCTEAMKLVKLADLLQCSTDYLLGREGPKQPGGWNTGTPPKEGIYIVVIKIDSTRQHYTKLAWKSDGWKFPGSDELAVDESTEVQAWIEPWIE